MEHFLESGGPGTNMLLAAGLLDDPSDSGWGKAQQFLQCLERVRVSVEREKRERQAKMGVEI
jgi:hypothetical protein